ncbi:MAG: DMT family transporter [Pseudomonadota bacterium]
MNPTRGIALKLGAVACFSVMAACVKAARVEIPAGQAAFFRCALALFPVVAYAAWRGPLSEAIRVQSPRAHFWRGVIGAAGMGLTFGALGLLPLPEVIAIGFAAPIIATALAVVMLGERVRLARWSAVLTGLLGVTIMIWPRLTLSGETTPTVALGAALALAGAFVIGLSDVYTRRMTRTETTLSIVFWFHISVSAASLLTLPFGWVWPTPTTWALLVASGLLGGAAQILLTSAYSYANASTLAPFQYSAMLYGLVLGLVVFAEVPSLQVLAGAGVVIAAGLFILYRERRLKRERGAITAPGLIAPNPIAPDLTTQTPEAKRTP